MLILSTECEWQKFDQALSKKQSDKIEIDLAPNLIKIDQNCHCAGACGGGDLGGGVLIRPGQASAVPLSLPPNERAAWLAHSPLLAQMRGRLLEDYSRPFSQPSPLSSLHTGGQHLRCQGWGKPGWGESEAIMPLGICKLLECHGTGHSVMSAISSSVAAPLLGALPWRRLCSAAQR